MRTRKASSHSNFLSSAASQEYYEPNYNFVGIISFSGMNLTNKVITGISLTITADKAGLGAWADKVAYLCKSNYQNATESATGLQYVGDALGTFTGSFYGNTTSHTISGDLLTAMAAYIAAGNNTFTIYNPNPTASSQGYSTNYLQWSEVTITVTYQEAVSTPTVSSSMVTMGTAVTVYTNRLSSEATHTLTYAMGSLSGTIATNVGASVSWTPPVSLAAAIPNATSGLCVITCYTYYSGTLTGIASCTVTLSVPATLVPSLSFTFGEAVASINAQFHCYVRTWSKLSVTITAAGIMGSTIASYRTTVNGATYTSASFTTETLNTAGANAISVTVTDSRGRTATASSTFTVVNYNPPSLTLFSAERCNSDGSAAQTDGNHVRISMAGSVSPVNNGNGIACQIYYKLPSASAWTEALTVTPANYAVSETNRLLPQTFDVLSSYDLKVRFADYFYYVEQTVGIGTKQVIMDFLHDGSGVAFGKVAETAGHVEFGWPLILASPLDVSSGGTGASTASGARSALGAVSKAGDTMTGNLTIQNSLYPSVFLTPTYNGTTNRTVFEGSYSGASSFAAWEDSAGSNRRMLEVRTAAYAPSLDNAVLLRTAVNNAWSSYRVFHTGMATPVPIANGGTGAAYAATARSNLGANNAANLTTGTLAMARLPFKVAYGSGNVNGSSALAIDYSSAGFTSVPYVVASYSTTGSNWSGDNGALKIYSKTTSGASIIVGGNFNTARAIDWIAIGV